MEIRLSSFKRGHGIRELLSDDLNEYWATDSTLPHGIQIAFRKLTYVEEVRIYLNFLQDDSYTPKEIEFLTGLTLDTMKFITVFTLVEPQGYYSLNVKHECFFIQIIIISNHQDGKDSHIRSLKILESKTKEMYINIEEH